MACKRMVEWLSKQFVHVSRQGSCHHDYIIPFPSWLSSDPPYFDEGSLLDFLVLQSNIQIFLTTFFRKNMQYAYKYIADTLL